MPLVRVDNWGLRDPELLRLVRSLSEIVADALSVGGVGHGGLLSMNDIEVVVRHGLAIDIHGKADYGISIEAMHFPEREEKLPRAVLEIKKGVLENGGLGYTGYVWITLVPAEFGEINDFDTVGDVERELKALE